MYANNELMFPHHAIPSLRRLRGPKWQALVDEVTHLPQTSDETLAFMLMMIRLNGCMGCETDSYRAMRGCDACAIQTLRRYKGTDDELLHLYEKARHDIQVFGGKSPLVELVRQHHTG